MDISGRGPGLKHLSVVGPVRASIVPRRCMYCVSVGYTTRVCVLCGVIPGRIKANTPVMHCKAQAIPRDIWIESEPTIRVASFPSKTAAIAVMQRR